MEGVSNDAYLVSQILVFFSNYLVKIEIVRLLKIQDGDLFWNGGSKHHGTLIA